MHLPHCCVIHELQPRHRHLMIRRSRSICLHDPDGSLPKVNLVCLSQNSTKKENFVEIHPQLFDLFIVLQIDRQTHAHTSHKPSHNLYGEGLISYKTVGCTVVHCAANFFIAKSIPVSAIIRVSHVPYHCLGI